MTMELQTKLHEIFFPYAARRLQEAKDKRTRFVHYTNAATATAILKNKEFWMREPSCMNDFREVEHGIDCLKNVYNSEKVGIPLRNALESLSPGIVENIDRVFSISPFNPRRNHFIACVSEHSADEDSHGRLSMWRAYGQSTGIAMVMNPERIHSSPGLYKLNTSPVAYFNDSHFADELAKVTQNIHESHDLLKGLDKNIIIGAVANMFRFAALATKHEGFHEEREWRLIYAPDLQSSNYMRNEVRVINGIPQNIYKIPLQSTEDGQITGAEIPDLIERIIIGPTQYPLAIYKAFIELLNEAGVQNPENKIFVSGIPLRSNG